MNTPDRAAQHDTGAGFIVEALVRAGLMGADDAAAATAVITEALAGESTAKERRTRGVMAEVAGYLGGVLVVAAVAIAMATQWGTMPQAARYWALIGCVALLAVAGLAVIGGGGGRATTAASDVRRRLASLLLTGAAVVAGVSVQYWAGNATGLSDGWVNVLGSAVLVVAALSVYALLTNGFAHLAFAGGSMWLIASLVGLMSFQSSHSEGNLTAVAFLLLAVAWCLAAERGWWRELALGRVVTGVIAFWGAQMLVFTTAWWGSDRAAWIGYLALAIVGVAGFLMYVRTQGWPYLGLGVVALTAAATEAAVDWSDGSLGAAGGLLVAGAVLLGASALGLRLRRHDQHSGGSGSAHALAG